VSEFIGVFLIIIGIIMLVHGHLPTVWKKVKKIIKNTAKKYIN
jgi:uncharacterized membrane protein YidH (DUF202 family)